MDEVFQRRSAWALWLEQVGRDVRGEAPARESRELRQVEHLMQWARALEHERQRVENRMAESRLRLRTSAPAIGEANDQAYLDAKREHDLRLARRIRYRQSVQERQQECLYLMDVHGLPAVSSPALVQSVLTIAELLERGEPDAALACAQGVLERSAA